MSAYTTAMADLSLPHYKEGKLIPFEEFHELTEKDLLSGYIIIIINTTFKFPTTVKYPYIPCYIDETTTVYPLQGSCLLTGPEYILAMLQVVL